MDSKVPQYQRAVTPTIDNSTSPSVVKGKVLSYNANLIRGGRTAAPDKLYGSLNIGASASARVTGASSLSPRSTVTADGGQGRPTSKAGIMYSSSAKQGTEVVGNPDSLAPAFSVLPRFDLVSLSEDLPSDGIIFAKTKTSPEVLVVFRTPEERLRNPERLNLDRRQLEVCPLLEQEQRLRLLNFQNNSIRAIQNLENLPNLIFLDLYNNKITSLDGPLCTVKGLRVLMAGKNKIGCISNLQPLRKLDVLDLHSNEIRTIEGLEGLSDLRVLNLAGNRISTVTNLSSLVSLTELNLRRNGIDCVTGLNELPALQRVFLSHNAIASVEAIRCLFDVNYLIELSLDGNPLSEADPAQYRAQLVVGMPGLRHLDLRRVTDEERAAAVQAGVNDAQKQPSVSSSTTDAAEGSLSRLPPRSGAGAGVMGHSSTVDAGAGADRLPAASTSSDCSSDEASTNAEDAPPSRHPHGAIAGEQRKGLQKYVPMSSSADARESGTTDSTSAGRSFGGIAIAGTAVEGTASLALAAAAGGAKAGGGGAGSSGLAALARAGKLFNTHSIFDLEVGRVKLCRFV